jgi:hypothetical protein
MLKKVTQGPTSCLVTGQVWQPEQATFELSEVVPMFLLVGYPGDDPHPPTKIAARTQKPTS